MIPSVQSNPTDLTNALLLRILQNNTSFNGTEPLAPVTNVPTSMKTAQATLIASLGVSLFAAFVAVLGKSWTLYYMRGSTWGSIVDRGKERQVKFMGLKKWGFYLIVESLPVMLQLAFLLFAIGLIVYLQSFDVSAAHVTLAVTCIGCALYACVVVVGTIWKDCPFKTPLPVLLRKVLALRKEITALVQLRWSTMLQRLTRRPAGNAHDDKEEFSNPKFWRHNPLFTPPLPEDISASAGFWLLENSTDPSAATAVTAVFSEFQWPSSHPSTTALIRLRDTYLNLFRGMKHPKEPTRLKVLQCAAAYYVLYHTQLVRSTAETFETEEVKLLRTLPSDLLLHEHEKEFGGSDTFEYLLHVEDHSESEASAQFLSYIAPFWCCGNSDSSLRVRRHRMDTIHELVQVLENSRELNSGTLTNCILCVGITVGFPLHPEDLIRVDKRCVCSLALAC